jgi:hypothetical protein
VQSLVVGEHRAGCVPSRVISPSTNVLVDSRAMFFIVPLSAVRACFFTSTCASWFGRLAFFHCPFRPGRLKLKHSRSESQHRSNRAESNPYAKNGVLGGRSDAWSACASAHHHTEMMMLISSRASNVRNGPQHGRTFYYGISGPQSK